MTVFSLLFVCQIGIRVQDKGLPTPLSATLPRVRITISDANDQNPTFNTTRYDFRVRENQDNVLVGTVYAEDLDYYKRTCYGLGRFLTQPNTVDLSCFLFSAADLIHLKSLFAAGFKLRKLSFV